MAQEVMGTVVQAVRGVGSQTLLSWRLQALGHLVEGLHTVLVTSWHLVWGTWGAGAWLGASAPGCTRCEVPTHRPP